MIKEFRAFLLRGNVVDLAVGIVIGAAFGAVVTALVKDLITPLISIPGTANFSDLHFTVRHSRFLYGDFLNTLIAFVVIAAAVFFFVVLPINRLMSWRKTETETESPTRQCPHCLSSIPQAATRCAFCTSEVPPVSQTASA
ncbi:MAG TPA: large conductance mechanosensitive channel protein MscL [Acidimicrobiales bacterium]|nr:large conductance mechanosensitive channel protein MscL [Acidimicrobiales bacterium]